MGGKAAGECLHAQMDAQTKNIMPLAPFTEWTSHTTLTGCILMSHPTSFAGSLQRSKPNLASISSFSSARCNLFSVESSRLQTKQCNNSHHNQLQMQRECQ